MLRILGRTNSINVRKVLWTCDELGLSYEREDWGMGFTPTDRPEFLALNPNGLVPVLIDEAGPLWESNTICRYLAAKYGRTDLLPTDLRRRAAVEQWMDWTITELNQSWSYAFAALARRMPGYDDQGRIAQSVKAWNKTMGILDRRLKETGAHVAGEDFTLADVLVGLAVHRWRATPMEHAELPAVERYFGRLQARPAIAAWVRPDVP